MPWHATCKANNQRKEAKKMQTQVTCPPARIICENSSIAADTNRVYRLTTESPWGAWLCFFMASSPESAADKARFYWCLPSTFLVSIEAI
jgi:hypothetical protein